MSVVIGKRKWYHIAHRGLVKKDQDENYMLEEAEEFYNSNKPYFFMDECVYQFTKNSIEYEVARMRARADRENEQSCLYFRQSLTGFCVWMMLMNSHIHSGNKENATTIKSIIDHTNMAKATAANHLKIAVDNGWAIKFEATETLKCRHWEASQLTMSEYLERLKRENECLPIKRYTSHAAFDQLQKHLRQFKEG